MKLKRQHVILLGIIAGREFAHVVFFQKTHAPVK